MVDLDRIVDDTIQLLGKNMAKNYRVIVLLVGPPGSGKSTVAQSLCDAINAKYTSYLSNFTGKHGESPIKYQQVHEDEVNILKNVNEISVPLQKYLVENDGIMPQCVEDVKFEPVKIQANDGSTVVIGRGGLPNSVKIAANESELFSNIELSQVVPMDGFHLSRNCLDNFTDPVEAHKRRGSPMTFDSNNFLQLCKALCETAKITARNNVGTIEQNNSIETVFDAVSSTFISNIPCICIPGFNHALKDPSTAALTIPSQSRILILEGLYLLYDKENWANIHKIVEGTASYLIYNIDISESVLQDRVAKRHLKSGLVSSYEEGVKKFQGNDLLNARDIKSNTIKAHSVITITND
ncbi:hypothetical protein TPHA_0H00620 [Tetrapisispora phaffii CBS 4417]|uniref:ATPase dynein-related AAA domain-containing protein n=1 Tax=Tetrapisispora phaffii (strain ATCC 24235 / CBS 4417 / NBRC 1672 / NRRL Y-8282 / UCD 70-5) TaxID=1071381 RepID=G8BWW8_TETPH|nr:hypothetical protein TPHA_0H00620 [Tetrapisispora phaffii CBS 4417]CCE64272.1 hypothetical protein TPHA_0H00620 [Tetrapisispora phaffii CBS 4417]